MGRPRRRPSLLLEQRWQLQPDDGHVDRNLDGCERAGRPCLSHGHLDRQGDDRLGWRRVGGRSQNSGAIYWACPEGRIVHRDADGDGHGDRRTFAPSCDGSIPAGYVADATDCDDSNTDVHPGAVEVCNGIDDNCNGLVDEDAFGEDSDGDQVHNLCDNCPRVLTPSQADTDHDTGSGETCDNCPLNSNPPQDDFDGDHVGDACDNCPTEFNPTQSDSNHDGIGDVCDLNDGLIWTWRGDKVSVSWQPEHGPTSWNVYLGDLDVLKETGVYTQPPGSNPLAARACGVTTTFASDIGVPPTGRVSFSLVSGVYDGTEGTLGASTAGPRTNAHPCP